MNKLIKFGLAAAALFFITLSNSYSDEKHKHQLPANNYQISSNGTALAIATSQIHPELGSSKLQLGFGLGAHNNDTALAIGIHKRVNEVLIGGTFSSGNGDTAIGAGINLKF